MKLIKLNKKTLVNPEAITHVTIIVSGDLDVKKLKDRLSIDELKALGFPIRRRDMFVSCSWAEAEKEVKNNPTVCEISHGCSGYVKLEGGDEDLVEDYLVYRDGKFETVHVTIPDDIVVGYDIHLASPNGGINYGHSIIKVKPSEFEEFNKRLEKVA